MIIHTGKALLEKPRQADFRTLVKTSGETYQDHPAYVFRRAPGAEEETRSYKRLWEDVQDLGEFLLDFFPAEDRAHVAHLGQNSYEWIVSYLAMMTAGTVAVPLDNQLPENEVLNLLQRGDCQGYIANAKHLEDAKKAIQEIPALKLLIVNDLTLGPKEKVPALPDEVAGKTILYLSQALAHGRKIRESGKGQYLQVKQHVEDVAAIFFTSGTTAQAKGVMLSQNNILENLHAIVRILPITKEDRFLSVLPMHHTFEHTAGQLYPLIEGSTIYFTDGLRYLGDNMREWHISCMIGVPLLFESIWRVVNRGIENSGKAGMVKLARPICRRLEQSGFKVRRKVFAQVIEQMGGAMRLMVVGAAAADLEVIKGFNDLGIEFYQGYGLTEHSPVVSAGNKKVDTEGSTGSPIPGVEVAIQEDASLEGGQGEVLVRSKSVMLGYYKNQEATDEAIDQDGWLHTGDMGYFDQKGCLHITGRYKSVIVLANGKKAFPEEIESLFKNVDGVSETLVWGEQNIRETLDVTMRFEVDLEKLPADVAKDDAAIAAYLQKEVKRVNQLIPDYKAIKYFVWSTDKMIRTTTLKVRRNPEIDRIHLALLEKGQTMRDADGSRVTLL